MTVAMMAATPTRMDEITPRMERARENQRVHSARGVKKIKTKFRAVPAVKNAIMTWDPSLRSVRMVVTAEGRAILAPARSSLTRTSTGLNQYKGTGEEQ